jgi:hypothetical protein
LSTTIPTWRQQGRVRTGDEVGGDQQAGECYTATFTSRELPGLRIDVHCYVLGPTDTHGNEISDPSPEWLTQVAATYHGPGGFEQSVYRRHPEEGFHRDIRAAEAAAQAYAGSVDASWLTWDGKDVAELYPWG